MIGPGGPRAGRADPAQVHESMPAEDTIIAVSSPRGNAPRAVVRLSGERAVQAVSDRFSAGPHAARPWHRTFTVTGGRLRLRAEGVSVPVLTYVMRAPHSYTREDVVEIHLPGSRALLDMVMDEFLAGGDVRLARPGEFTQRAFLNGRIDLAQAEAVLAVIRARSDAELLAAAEKLEGGASRECRQIQGRVAELRALVEAALDFQQHGIEIISPADIRDRLDAVEERLRHNLEGARDELADDGTTRVVICGPPNAGKSSLLNRLAGTDRAIVNPEPGTTRDAVTVRVELHGVEFTVSDTAGMREPADGLEAAAAGMTDDRLRRAQLVMLVLDASRPITPEAARLLDRLPSERLVLVLNKCDLPEELREDELRAGAAQEIVHTSALTGEGIERLRDALGRVVTEGRLDASPADCLFNARQRDAVRRALRHLQEARRATESGIGYEFVALHLREINDDLGEISGRVTPNDVLDRIFSQFCIGK